MRLKTLWIILFTLGVLLGVEPIHAASTLTLEAIPAPGGQTGLRFQNNNVALKNWSNLIDADGDDIPDLAEALALNPANCTTSGHAAAGVSAAGTAEGCLGFADTPRIDLTFGAGNWSADIVLGSIGTSHFALDSVTPLILNSPDAPAVGLFVRIDPASSSVFDFVDLGLNDGTPNEGADLLSWSKLKDVPAGFADGTDDGAGAVDADNVNLSPTVRGQSTAQSAFEVIGEWRAPAVVLSNIDEHDAVNVIIGGYAAPTLASGGRPPVGLAVGCSGGDWPCEPGETIIYQYYGVLAMDTSQVGNINSSACVDPTTSQPRVAACRSSVIPHWVVGFSIEASAVTGKFFIHPSASAQHLTALIAESDCTNTALSRNRDTICRSTATPNVNKIYICAADTCQTSGWVPFGNEPLQLGNILSTGDYSGGIALGGDDASTQDTEGVFYTNAGIAYAENFVTRRNLVSPGNGASVYDNDWTTPEGTKTCAQMRTLQSWGAGDLAFVDLDTTSADKWVACIGDIEKSLTFDGFDAIADVTNGIRWENGVPTAQSNTCLLIQSVLNPSLAEDTDLPYQRRVLVVGSATISNSELWDQGGTLPYGLCFGRIPGDDKDEAGAWIGGTYPDVWPDVTEDCDEVTGGVQPCSAGNSDRSTDIAWQVRLVYDEGTGTHGGGASARPTVIYQRGNSFLAGNMVGYYNTPTTERGQFALYFEDDSDGGLAISTHLAMDREGLITASRDGSTQTTASVGIFDSLSLRQQDYASWYISGNWTTSSGDNDNIGWIRQQGWLNSYSGRYAIQHMAVASILYGNVIGPWLNVNFEGNQVGLQFGDAVNGSLVNHYSSCYATGSACDTEGVRMGGLDVRGGTIEGNGYGNLVAFDFASQNSIENIHFESATLLADGVLIGAGVCSDVGAVWKPCSLSSDAQCGSGHNTCTPYTAANLGGQLRFIGGTMDSDGQPRDPHTWGGLRFGLASRVAKIIFENVEHSCSWIDDDDDDVLEGDEVWAWEGTSVNGSTWVHLQGDNRWSSNCRLPDGVPVTSDKIQTARFALRDADQGDTAVNDCLPISGYEVVPPVATSATGFSYCLYPVPQDGYTSYGTPFTRKPYINSISCRQGDSTGWDTVGASLRVQAYDYTKAATIGPELTMTEGSPINGKKSYALGFGSGGHVDECRGAGDPYSCCTSGGTGNCPHPGFSLLIEDVPSPAELLDFECAVSYFVGP